MEKKITRTVTYLLVDFGKIIKQDNEIKVEIVLRDTVLTDIKDVMDILNNDDSLIIVSKKEVTEKREISLIDFILTSSKVEEPNE